MSSEADKPEAVAEQGTTIPFAALVALLGGARARGLVVTAAARLDQPHAWLSPGATAEHASQAMARQFAAEVLALKLHTFVALCRIWQPNGADRAPAAEHFAARCHAAAGSVTPARWSFELVVREGAGDDAAGPPMPAFGRLLAQLLLSNDARTADEAATVATAAAERLQSAASMPGGQSGAAFDAATTQVMQSECGDARNVVHDAAVRQRLGAGFSIPCWRDSVDLSLRLIAGLTSPNGVRKLIDEVTPLLERARVHAFGAAAREQEITALLRDNLAGR